MSDLFEDLVKDLYNAEKQLIKALPKVAKAASSETLRNAIQTHLEETEEQARLLEGMCREIGIKPTGKVCKAMQGLIEEANELLKEGKPSPVMDAGIIGSAQKVEHYEIAGYGTAVAFAQQLGHQSAVSTLNRILQQEGDTDKKLNAIAEGEVNQRAAQMPPMEQKRGRSNGASRSSGSRSSSSKSSGTKSRSRSTSPRTKVSVR
jgi:ferritin-like metal-binding protein YciE